MAPPERRSSAPEARELVWIEDGVETLDTSVIDVDRKELLLTVEAETRSRLTICLDNSNVT